MRKSIVLSTLVIAMASPMVMGQTFFSEDFDTGGTAGALSRGWEFVENEFVTETGSNFVVAPEWPEGQDGPGTSTGFINPPTADGTESSGGYLMSDSDAGGGSDDINSESLISAITPVFSTAGASEVWFHADAEIEGNNNGEALGIFDYSVDGGATWLPVWVMVEPDRPNKDFTQFGRTLEIIGEWPELGSASQTKTFDGVHGRWHLQLPAGAANQSSVQLRFGWFEPADAWWYALDNIVVDSNGPPMGEETVLSEDFSGGIPSTWSNTAAKTQTWDTRVLWNNDFDEPLKISNDLPMNVDILRAAEFFDFTIDLTNPDPDLNPRGYLDGRWMLMLAGGDYAMWQEGDLEVLEGEASEAGMLDTPVLDLSGTSGVFIDFDSEVLVGSGSAVYDVQVSTDGGSNFDTIFTYTGALMNYEEAPYFMHHYLEVPQAAGSSNVVFRFLAVGEDPGEMEGFWVIDNVSVTVNRGASVQDWMMR